MSAESTATVRYEMTYGNWLLSKQQQADGVRAWHLVRKVATRSGSLLSFDPIAIFNLDSEGMNFQRHLAETGGKIDIDPEVAQLIDLERRRR